MSFATTRIIVLAVALLTALTGCIALVSEREIALEAETQFEEMREQMGVSSNLEARQYIYCVSFAIIETLEPPYSDLDWEIEIFDSEMINAFAMPGGKIGVFTGILSVAENQDQLGAVIGHEVAHVTEQHSYERANRAAATQVGAMAAGAALGGGAAGQVVMMGAQLGILLPYGRGQESESDVVGLRYMSDAGFDPRQSVELWKNMAEKNKGAPPEFLSTHPSSDSRIQDLVRELPGSLPRYNAARAKGNTPNCQPPASP